jgi:hypothetical protein
VKIPRKDDLPVWVDSPVLLYGARKSGTTMLRNLHDGGDRLLCLPSDIKLKFFIETLWHDQPNAANKYYNLSSMFSYHFQDFDKEAYQNYVAALLKKDIKCLRDLIRYDIYGFYNCIHRRPKALKMWAMKEVGGNTVGIFSVFRQMFFNGKIINIVRNPLSITRSVLLNRRRKKIKLSSRKIFKQVYEPLKVLYHQSKLIEDKSIHFVSYENITFGNLEEQMRASCKYLGIPYEEVFKITTILGKAVVTSTSSQNSTKVFVNTKKWYNGLSLKEILTVISFYSAIREYFKVKYNWSGHYGDVLKKIEARSREF